MSIHVVANGTASPALWLSNVSPSICSTGSLFTDKAKRQPTEWEKILANNMTNKGLTSKTYKQLIKKRNNLT